MHWTEHPELERLQYAMKNIYMLAKRKRVVTHQYETDPQTGKTIAIPNGPKSTDEDWDHIIRFCEDAGLVMDIIRIAKAKTMEGI